MQNVTIGGKLAQLLPPNKKTQKMFKITLKFTMSLKMYRSCEVIIFYEFAHCNFAELTKHNLCHIVVDLLQ